MEQGKKQNAWMEVPSDRYLLTDIDNVPDLSTVTAEQALSYLNQSLENLILMYQSTSVLRDSDDLMTLISGSFRSPSLSSPEESQSELISPQNGAQSKSNESQSTFSPPSSPKTTEEINSGEEINGKRNQHHHNDNNQSSPLTESEAESVQSDQSKLTAKSHSSSSSSSSTSLASANRVCNITESGVVKTKSNNGITDIEEEDPEGVSNSQVLTSASNTSATATPPHSMPKLTPKPSADPNSILEEAAVVAAVLIEGTEQRRRSSGKLAPVDSRIIPPPHNGPHCNLDGLSNNGNESSNNQDKNNSNDNNNNKNNDSQAFNDSFNNSNDDMTSNDDKQSINNDNNNNDNNSNNYNNNKENTSRQKSPAPTTTRPAVSKKEMAQKGLIIKRFWSRSPPGITIWKYLLRIHKYTPLSTSVYLSTSLYIYRLCIELQTILLTPLSVHRIVLASLRIACKVIEDVSYKQDRVASVGGVERVDLYRLEIAFLFLIDFDVCINSQVLQEHMVMLTELQIQADRHRQLLSKKRPRSADPAFLPEATPDTPASPTSTIS